MLTVEASRLQGGNTRAADRGITGWLVRATFVGMLAPAMLAAGTTALGTNAITVGSGAGSSSVILTAPGPWTAFSNNNFLHLAPGSVSGSGNALVVFTVDAFAGTGTRSGSLTIAGLNLAVTQVGTNYAPVYPVTSLVSEGLVYPASLALDSTGNVYILDADAESGDIKEWNALTQQVTTTLPNGPDYVYLVSPCVVRTAGGELTWSLIDVNGLALDGAGNFYWPGGESFNAAVCKFTPGVQPDPVSTLVQGLDTTCFGGIAVDASGNIYLGDPCDQAVYKWSPSTHQVTTVEAQSQYFPDGVAVDALGNVYFADWHTQAAYMWSAATQQVTTLVSGEGRGSAPTAVAVDGSGNVDVLDSDNNAVYQWNPATQKVTTVVSSGLNLPGAIAADGSGNIYIADTFNYAVKEVKFAFETLATTSLTEGSAAGSDSAAIGFLPVLPATWTASTPASWLHVTTPSGTGAGNIGFTFDANTGAARAGTITVDSGLTLTVTQGSGLTQVSQTITFGTLTNQPFGAATFAVSATASSGLTVGFNSLTGPVCMVTGVMVTLNSTGTCTIQATQGGNTTYAAAPAVSQSFQVTQGGQTITFGALANQLLGVAPFAVSATASSGLAVGFASNPAVCTVLGSTVTIVGWGTCSVTASQAGNTNYAAAPSVTQSFTVSPAFFSGAANGGNGTLYLQLPDGSPFGYYVFLGGGWMYHADLGYEYVAPGNGPEVYFWDLSSGHWWYTNTNSFPYMYDFTMNTWVYYFPNTHSAGHYLTNPRYFANMTTGVIFTM